MKKYLALIMVMVLAFSMTMTAFAERSEDLLEKVWSDGTNVISDTDAYPAIMIELDVLAVSATDVSYDDYLVNGLPMISVVKAADSNMFVITEDIQGVGHFFYTVKEKADAVAGVTYDATEYLIEVYIQYNTETAEEYDTIVTYEVTPVSDIQDKKDTITNTYKVGDLTIDKAVTGNLSDKEDKFDVKVTFESKLPVLTDIVNPYGKVITLAMASGSDVYSYTETISISDNDGVLTYTGIPEGVLVSVEELECDPYTLVGYEIDDAASDTAPLSQEDMTDAGIDVVITNDYTTEIATGITLDSLPYILVLAAVAGGLGYFFIKKRQNAFDAD